MPAQTLRREDVVVSFDDDLTGGVTLTALAAGESIVTGSMFVETPITATLDESLLTVFVGAEVVIIGNLALNPSYFGFTATQGQLLSFGYPPKETTVVVKESPANSGAWTAGSVRFELLIASDA